jgi:hypothetical protein
MEKETRLPSKEQIAAHFQNHPLTGDPGIEAQFSRVTEAVANRFAHTQVSFMKAHLGSLLDELLPQRETLMIYYGVNIASHLMSLSLARLSILEKNRNDFSQEFLYGNY